MKGNEEHIQMQSRISCLTCPIPYAYPQRSEGELSFTQLLMVRNQYTKRLFYCYLIFALIVISVFH